jgi:hypothetical protein
MIGLLIDGLAAWRVTVMLLYEDGPFGIIKKLRVALCNVHPTVSDLFSCEWCLSVWVGLAVTLLPFKDLWRALAISTLVIRIDQWIK